VRRRVTTSVKGSIYVCTLQVSDVTKVSCIEIAPFFMQKSFWKALLVRRKVCVRDGLGGCVLALFYIQNRIEVKDSQAVC